MPAWRRIASSDPEVLAIVQEGFLIPFHHKPPLSRRPVFTSPPSDHTKFLLLQDEVQALLCKDAIEMVINHHSPGFYSRLFLVTKKNGKLRPVIDLSSLNKFVFIRKFKMETSKSIRNAVQPGEFAVSVDLSDAYFHISIRPESRKYLRFTFNNRIYQFKVLPFGLSSSPEVFTRVMTVAITHFRTMTGIYSSSYLDDILMKDLLKVRVQHCLLQFLSYMRGLGFLVNKEKSQLVPVQDFVHVGLHFKTHLGLVSVPQDRAVKIQKCVNQFINLDRVTARFFLVLLGHLNAAADLIPLGRLLTRPLQHALSLQWQSKHLPYDHLVKVTSTMKEACASWLDIRWLTQGVPLKLPPVTHTICSDASTQGWGGHLIPSGDQVSGQYPDRLQVNHIVPSGDLVSGQCLERFKVDHITPSGDQVSGQCPERLRVDHVIPSGDQVSGQWPERLKMNHINWLEMRAVALVLRHFLPVIQNSHVMLHTDNSTVAAYIRRQGGTKSLSLTEEVSDLLNWARRNSITLSVSHISGNLNVIADRLSRKGQAMSTEWSIHPSVIEAIKLTWGTPLIDLFATAENFKFPVYVSPCPDSRAWAVDALSLNWDGMFAYAFPPFPLIPKVLQKIQTTQCRVILVAPLWPSRSWFSLLTSLLYDFPKKVPARFDLLKQPRSTIFCKNVQSKNLHVWPLSGRLSDQNTFQNKCRTELPILEGDLPPACIMLSGGFSTGGVLVRTYLAPQLLFHR